MERFSDTKLRFESKKLINAAITEDKAKNYDKAVELYQSALKYYFYLTRCTYLLSILNIELVVR
mgnify:CR=1 FL=1